MRRAAALVLLLALLSGCGEGDAERLRDRAQSLEQRAREQTEQIRQRIDEILGEIERAIPEARRTNPQVRRDADGQTIEDFLTRVIVLIDDYWTTTLTQSGLEEPVVNYHWVAPGRRYRTACGPAGPDAAFYCPGDDTIYVAQEFAAALYRGVLRGLPGERQGRAVGDFGVAYVVAHEYAHNLQQELGILGRLAGATARPFELQADCLAGAWGNSVYQQGLLDEGDIEEAIGTALAVGDFDINNRQHHGTPEERRAAWLLGFESGRPSECERYVPVG